jgi:hypothetical protein
MKCKFVAISVFMLLAGCAETVNPGRAPLNLPTPQPIHMRPVKWTVLPQNDNADDQDPSKKGALVGMSEDSYKNLSQNFRDILNYMAIQRKVINSYKEYYEPES